MNALLQIPRELVQKPLPKRKRRYGLSAQILELLGERALPKRDRKRLADLRKQPCEVCAKLDLEQCTRTEAAHMGPHGISQKACDLKARPICAEHHRIGPKSAHVLGRRFETYHGLE